MCAHWLETWLFGFPFPENAATRGLRLLILGPLQIVCGRVQVRMVQVDKRVPAAL